MVKSPSFPLSEFLEVTYFKRGNEHLPPHLGLSIFWVHILRICLWARRYPNGAKYALMINLPSLLKWFPIIKLTCCWSGFPFSFFWSFCPPCPLLWEDLISHRHLQSTELWCTCSLSHLWFLELPDFHVSCPNCFLFFHILYWNCLVF